MLLVPIPADGQLPDGIQDSEYVRDMLTTYTEYYPKIGFNIPWIGYFIVDDGIAVGSCGFTGKPSESRVELAYYTFPIYEGNGIASFACETLKKIALAADPKLTITAKTSPEENASTYILRKNGFQQRGVVQDDGIGDAREWIFISEQD